MSAAAELEAEPAAGRRARPPAAEFAGRLMGLVHVVAEHGPMTIYDLAAASDRPLSSTYRHVETLCRAGYLQQADRTRPRRGGAYDVGPRARDLLAGLHVRFPRSARLSVAEAVLRETFPRAEAGALHHLAGRLVDALTVLDRP